MGKLSIVGWTDFECKYPSKECQGEEFREIMQLISEEVIKNGYCFGGQDHQNSATGVPVFSDGTCLRASMRSWGYIMSAIHSELDGINYNYMDFYVVSTKGTKLPEFATFDIESAIVDEERPGIIVDEDIRLISETLSMGMDLMTTDKIIKMYIELLKKSQE